jgi:DNA replication protein DnaC
VRALTWSPIAQREYTRLLVLIVDDFAMREHTPTQSDDLYDLVSDRAVAASR